MESSGFAPAIRGVYTVSGFCPLPRCLRLFAAGPAPGLGGARGGCGPAKLLSYRLSYRLGAVEAIPAPLVNKFTEAHRASERPSRAAGAPGMALFSTTKIELCMQPPQTRPSEPIPFPARAGRSVWFHRIGRFAAQITNQLTYVQV